MDSELGQTINIELTESEAHWLLSLVQGNLQQDQSAIAARLTARLAGAFPISEQHSNESENVPTEQELQTQRSKINAELLKLGMRETFVEGSHIRKVLVEHRRYPSERVRLSEIGRRLSADVEYQTIKKQKSTLKSELAKISNAIAALPKTPVANSI